MQLEFESSKVTEYASENGNEIGVGKKRIFGKKDIMEIKRNPARIPKDVWPIFTTDDDFEAFKEGSYMRQEVQIERKVYHPTLQLNEWKTLGLFQTLKTMEEASDVFSSKLVREECGVYDPYFRYDTSSDTTMSVTYDYDISTCMDKCRIHSYSHLMELLAMLNTSQRTLMNTEKRGGYWGVLIQLQSFDTSPDDGDSDSNVINYKIFASEMEDVIQKRLGVLKGVQPMCVLTFVFDPVGSKFVTTDKRTLGLYALVVFQRAMPAKGFKRYDTKIDIDEHVHKTGGMKVGDDGIWVCDVVSFMPFNTIVKLLFYLSENTQGIDTVTKSTVVPLYLQQNYCLNIIHAQLKDFGAQMLMHLILAKHWKTDINFDAARAHLLGSLQSVEQEVTFIKYDNVDLQTMMDPKQVDSRSMNYEQLVQLRYDIQEKLQKFNREIQDEVFLCKGLHRQIELLIAHGYLSSPAAFDRSKHKLGFLINLVGAMRVMRKIWDSFDEPEMMFLQPLKYHMRKYMSMPLRRKLCLWYNQYAAFMRTTYSSAMAALCLQSWPGVFRCLPSSERFLHKLLHDRFADNVEVQGDRVIWNGYCAEALRMVTFFNMYLVEYRKISDHSRDAFLEYSSQIDFVRLAVERKSAYHQINAGAYQHFFHEDEWTTGVRKYDALAVNKSAMTLTDFIDLLFSCEHRKVSILIQSGETNSGKSHSAQAWISLLYQLNGVFIGSDIGSDFQRVSHLGRRHLRIIEEYKSNIIKDFHHLESNGKQLYSNNASVPTRIGLVVVNCDKRKYTLEDEASRLLDGDVYKETQSEVQSRVGQVKSRSYILNWEDTDNLCFQQHSKRFREVCNEMSRMISNTIMTMRLQTDLGACHHKIDVHRNEILLRWDMSVVPKMRYVQVLQAYGDMAAWSSALTGIFTLITKRDMWQLGRNSVATDSLIDELAKDLVHTLPLLNNDVIDATVKRLKKEGKYEAKDITCPENGLLLTTHQILCDHTVIEGDGLEEIQYRSPDWHSCTIGKF